MVLRKITKKKYRTFRGGAAPPPPGGKEGDNSANNAKIAATVTDKNIKDFKNEDFPRGWIIHDLYLAAPVKTEKDYIKQAIVVKRKKAEKKKKEEKFSTVKGIETLKKSTGGLFAAIQKGMTEGRQNFDKFMQGAESIKRGLTMQGKYGRQFSGQMSKARAASQKASATYSSAKAEIKGLQEKQIKEKREADNTKFQASMGKAKETLGKLGITDLKSLESKIDKIQDSVEKLNEEINKILTNMGGSFRNKGNDFNEKKEKFTKAFTQYDILKKEIFNDETNLIEIYMKRNNEKYKGIAGMLVKKDINVLIQKYLEILTKIYQGFLYFVFNYLFYKKREGEGKDVIDEIERYLTQEDSIWNRFYNDELDDKKEYNLEWLAKKLPQFYYQSLCTVGNKGLIDTSQGIKSKGKDFGDRKLLVLYVSAHFIKENNNLYEGVIKKGNCEHLKKVFGIDGKKIDKKKKDTYIDSNNKIDVTGVKGTKMEKVIEKINALIKSKGENQQGNE